MSDSGQYLKPATKEEFEFWKQVFLICLQQGYSDYTTRASFALRSYREMKKSIGDNYYRDDHDE